mmetsp:Transcript_11443/g.27313  ORF Transcript_11443/g.27313 Transcript_11443/m.27313 type:complete len:1344 (+) Transcript_11443:155-4186(+)
MFYDVLNRWIASFLARYLDVKEESVSANLLASSISHDEGSGNDSSSDGGGKENSGGSHHPKQSSRPTLSSLVLRDIEIRPMRIPWKKHRIRKRGERNNKSTATVMTTTTTTSKPESYTTWLNVSGKISKVDLSLQWSSFMTLKQSIVELDGLDILLDVTVEKDPHQEATAATWTSKDGTGNISSKHDTADDDDDGEDDDNGDSDGDGDTFGIPLWWRYIKQEQERLMAGVRDIIPSSDILRRSVFHLLNTIHLNLSNVEVQMISTRDDSEVIVPSAAPTVHLIVSFDRFHFRPAPSSQVGNSESKVNIFNIARMLDVELENLKLDLAVTHDEGPRFNKNTSAATQMEEEYPPESPPKRSMRRQGSKQNLYNVFPVLESISFLGKARRIYGISYFDMLNGYELIGRIGSSFPPWRRRQGNTAETNGISAANESGGSNGNTDDEKEEAVKLHLGAFRQSIIALAYNLLLDAPIDDTDDIRDGRITLEDEKIRATTARRRRKTSRMLAKSLLSFLGLVTLYLCRSILLDITRIVSDFQKIIEADPTGIPSIIYHALLVGSCVTILVYSKMISTFLRSEASMVFRNAMNLDAAQKNPALVNLRLNRINVLLSQGDSLRLSDLSITGRLNATLINLWSRQALLVPGEKTNSPYANAKDIRAAKNDNGWTVKFGSIDELIVPEKIAITEPMIDTVLHFGRGKLNIDLDRVVGVRLDTRISNQNSYRKTPSNKSDSFGVDVDDNIRHIDKDEIRKRINEDINTELHKFHTIALMFEGIPLKTNKVNLWRYPHTFCGSEAVDYLLELNIAESRDDAVRIGNQLKTDFDLFEDVLGDVYPFKDRLECIYKFKKPDNRRNWERNFRSIRGTTGSSGDDGDGDVAQLISFLPTIRANELVLVDHEGNKTASMKKVHVLAKPSSYIRALEVFVSVTKIETEILLVGRARLQGYYHPDLPSEIHDGQFSVEHMKAAGGFSAESWYKTLGLRGNETALEREAKRVVDNTKATTQKITQTAQEAIEGTESTAAKLVDQIDPTTSSTKNKKLVKLKLKGRWKGRIPHHDGMDNSLSRPEALSERGTSSGSAASQNSSSLPAGDDDIPKGAIRLPYFYIAPFTLRLKLKGMFASSKENRIRVEKYEGDESTTSNDLIVHFVTVVLGRSPGMIGNMNIMGVNVAEGGGMAVVWTTAAMIPGGQYLGMAVIAAMDGVNGAISAGKRSRGKPDDNFKVGDFVRGIAYGATELNQKGAMRRGKIDEDYYDSDGRVKVDVGDFATGAALGMGDYIDERKGKFAGAAVGAATVVTLTILAGPLAGLGLALLFGAATEIAVDKIDENIMKKKEAEVYDHDGDRDSFG